MEFHWLLKRMKVAISLLMLLFLMDGQKKLVKLKKRRKELMPPEEVGEQIASVLLGEIEQGGVVDLTHQVRLLNKVPALFFLLVLS